MQYQAIQGYIESLGPTKADVVLFTPDGPREFFGPRAIFENLGLGEGDGFWLDAVDGPNGQIVGTIRRPDTGPPVFEGPYESPDDLSALARALRH